MAKIRHIAIKVEDQEKAAEFYKKAFGMTEAWRGPVRDDGNRNAGVECAGESSIADVDSAKRRREPDKSTQLHSMFELCVPE